MSDLHPHWDTTDSSEQPVPVRIKAKPRVAPPSTKKPPQVNRFPAAIFGIIAIAAAGFVVFDGMDLLQGQTVIDATDVHISATGLDPAEVMIQPGESIRWMNDDAIPHILASDMLKDEDGETFETTAIFPGSDHVFTVPAGTLPGTYDYESRTSPSINGMIKVALPQTFPAVTQSRSSVAAMPMSQAASSIAALPVVPSSASQAAVASAGGIPTNPYALSNTNYSAASTNPVAATVTTHRPANQPSTGMGLWMAGLAGVIALFFVLRKSSVRL